MKWVIQLRICEFLFATVKELLKSDGICESYAQMKKGPVFLTHRLRSKSRSDRLLQLTEIGGWS